MTGDEIYDLNVDVRAILKLAGIEHIHIKVFHTVGYSKVIKMTTSHRGQHPTLIKSKKEALKFIEENQ